MLPLVLMVLMASLTHPMDLTAPNKAWAKAEVQKSQEAKRAMSQGLRGIPLPAATISGNWEITGEEVRSDEVIVLTGNLTVKSGGNLTLLNVTLIMNCSYEGEFGITVEPGGEMNVLDGSNITSYRANYWFHVQDGASFRMEDSSLSKCGCSGISGLPRGLLIEADDALVENSTITDCPYGLYIQNARGVVVKNCTFRDISKAVIYGYGADELLVEGNDINGTVILPGGWWSSSLADGIVVENSENVTIRDNLVTRLGRLYGGLAVLNAHNVTVIHNNVTYSGSRGIYLRSCSDVDVGFNYVAYNSGSGIELDCCQDGTIYNNTFVHDGLILSGMNLDHYVHTVENNTVNGKRLYYAHGLAGGTVPTEVGEVILVGCDGVHVEDITIGQTDLAVELAYCSSTTVENLTVLDADGIRATHCEGLTVDGSSFVNGTLGIDLDYCEAVSITDCNLTGQSRGGIWDVGSSGLNITGCHVNGTDWAVDLLGTENVLFRDNLVAKSSYGLLANHVTNLTARDNVFDHNRWGMILDRTSGFGPLKEVIIRDNTFYRDSILLEGVDDTELVIDVFEGNTVNGRPIYYVLNETGYTAPTDAGSIIIVNSTGITVEGLNLSYTDVGVEIAFCSDVTIEDLIATGDLHAIHLYSVEDVLIKDCDIYENDEVGIYMAQANHTAVLDNEFTGNGPADVMAFAFAFAPYGCVIVDHTALNITISGNTMANSTTGVSVLISFPVMPAGQILNVSIRENIILNNTAGIYVANFRGASSGALSGLLVEENEIEENDFYGIYLMGCLNTTIANNNFFNNTSPSIFGPWAFAGGGYGLLASECLGMTIANNTFFNDGIFLDGSELEHFLVDTFYNNTVDGRPIYYVLNEVDYTAPSDAGSLIIVNSTDITIEALNLSYTDVGVEIAFCSDTIINRTTLTHDNYGLYVFSSNNTGIFGSTISQDWEGIAFDECHNVTVAGCWVGQGFTGLDLDDVENATITFNMIMGNLFMGIRASETSLQVLNNSITYNGPPIMMPSLIPIGMGLYCSNCPVAEVHYNNIYGNVAFGLYAYDCVVNATYNWWNSTTGPEYTSTPDRIDPEEVFTEGGQVLYKPWLTEPVEVWDTTPPSVAITEPEDNSFVKGTVVIVVEASDRSGIANVSFYIDDTLMFVDEEAPYEYEWDTTGWADGIHNITVLAYDNAGNSNSTYILVEVDNTVPEGDILAPEAGSYLSGWVDVNVTGGDKNLLIIELYVNDTLLASWDANGTYTCPWNTAAWADGPYVLKLVVKDRAGNELEVSKPVVVDNTAPEGAINEPADGAYLSGITPINITGEDKNLEVIELYINDTLVASWTANGTYVYDWNTTAWADGAYFIKLLVRDLAGNEVEATITVIVDNTVPEGEVLTPTDGSYLRDVVDINITAGDANLDVIELYINDTLVASWNASGTYTYIWNTTAVPDGLYVIKLLVRDLAGNVLEDIIEVIVDNTEPGGVISSPSDGSYLAGLVQVNITGEDKNLEAIELYVNGTLIASWAISGTHIYTWNTTELADGTYILCLVVRDLAGNIAETCITVVVDNTSPEVGVEAPGQGEYVRGTYTIRIYGSDAHLAILELYLDGTLITSWSGSEHSYVIDTTTLADGLHNITVRAVDLAGNSAEHTVAFYVDNTAPEIGEPGLSPEEPVEGEDVAVSVAISDALSGVAEVILSYSTDGGATWMNITMTPGPEGAYEGTIPGQPAGTEVLYKIYARDAVGNWAIGGEGSYTVSAPPSPPPGPPTVAGVPLIYVVGGVAAAVAVAGLAIFLFRRR